MIKYIFNPFTNNLDAINYTEAVAPKMAGVAVDGTAVNVNYASYTPLIIGTTDIEVASPVNVVGSTTPLLAILTFRVQNPGVATQTGAFNFRIYNVNDGVAVNDTESMYQSYLLPSSETAETTFTYHIYLTEDAIDLGDVLQVQVKEFNSSYPIEITYASFTLMSITN
jgi:hypothetical protein